MQLLKFRHTDNLFLNQKVFNMSSQTLTPNHYAQLLSQIKGDIQQSQLRAALSVTQELTSLYWRIGKKLSEMIQKEGWGPKFSKSSQKI